MRFAILLFVLPALTFAPAAQSFAQSAPRASGLGGSPGGSPGGSAVDLMGSAHILGVSEYTSVEATMTIHGSRGDQERRIEVYVHRDDSGASRILAQVVQPAFLTNMRFLMHRDADGAQQRWMKTSRGVRRLSNANFADSVFGSDFTVEDFSYLDTSDYEFRFVDGSPQDGNGLRTVEGRLREPSGDVARKEFHIDEASGLIRGIDYFDEAGQLVKQLRTPEMTLVGGTRYPKTITMSDLAAGTSTDIVVEELDVQRVIPDRFFNRAAM